MKQRISHINDVNSGRKIDLPFPIYVDLDQKSELVLLEIIERLIKYIRENQ